MYKKIISYLLIFTLFLGTLQNVGIVRGDTGNEESWEIDLSSNNTSMTFMYEPRVMEYIRYIRKDPIGIGFY